MTIVAGCEAAIGVHFSRKPDAIVTRMDSAPDLFVGDRGEKAIPDRADDRSANRGMAGQMTSPMAMLPKAMQAVMPTIGWHPRRRSARVMTIHATIRLASFCIKRVLVHGRGFMAFIVGVCAIAATVACFQTAVFASFLRAGAVAPVAIGGDVWIMARGVQCFDFPTIFSRDYQGVVARYLPDAGFRRVAFGFTEWRSPGGMRANVAIIGTDDGFVQPTAFVADRSDLARLDLTSGDADDMAMPPIASIGNISLHPHDPVDNLATFLGAPYVRADFDVARRALGMATDQTSFLVADLPGGLPEDFDLIQRDAARDFPEIEMMSGDEFRQSSSAYWQAKTGAGTAILLAAVLAALLMNVLLVSAIGRFVQRYDQDLLSLLGHGADQRDIAVIIGGVVTLIAITALAIALLAAPLVAATLRPLLPWVEFRLTDMAMPVIASGAGLVIALLLARRAVDGYGPQAVFRS